MLIVTVPFCAMLYINDACNLPGDDAQNWSVYTILERIVWTSIRLNLSSAFFIHVLGFYHLESHIKLHMQRIFLCTTAICISLFSTESKFEWKHYIRIFRKNNSGNYSLIVTDNVVLNIGSNYDGRIEFNGIDNAESCWSPLFVIWLSARICKTLNFVFLKTFFWSKKAKFHERGRKVEIYCEQWAWFDTF